MTERKPERELCLLLLGACLVGAPSRDAVLKAVRPEDFPDEDLRSLAAALSGKDTNAVAQSLEGFGVKLNGKVLESVIERGARQVLNRKVSYEMARISAASKCESTIDLEAFLVDTIQRLSKLVATKGNPQ